MPTNTIAFREGVTSEVLMTLEDASWMSDKAGSVEYDSWTAGAAEYASWTSQRAVTATGG